MLSEPERIELTAMARSRSIPAALVARARIVLAAAASEANSAIAKRLQLTGATVGKWRQRYLKYRLNGLYDELRPGKPRSIDDERVAELINKTLHTKPAGGATHWSVRTIAAETAISPTSVHRYFKLLGLKPHRTEHFKLSTDPFFIEKLRDVVGLYLSPPENAIVLCVDEKSQCQALERTQPSASDTANWYRERHRAAADDALQRTGHPAKHGAHRRITPGPFQPRGDEALPAAEGARAPCLRTLTIPRRLRDIGAALAGLGKLIAQAAMSLTGSSAVVREACRSLAMCSRFSEQPGSCLSRTTSRLAANSRGR